jgi:hypothetical protein
MHERTEQHQQDEASEPVAVEPPAPIANDLALASAVGNRALAMAIASQRGGAPARRIARDGAPPAPGTADAPADAANDEFKEEDKERARRTIIGPLRAAATQLGAGPKANMGSIARHLRPVFLGVVGIKWKPPEVASEAVQALDDLPAIIDMVEDLKLSDRQKIGKIRGHWATSKRDLDQAEKRIRDANVPSKKHPDQQMREGAAEDMAAIMALHDQVDATMKDLAEAPRTQEGYKAVLETAGNIMGQFETIKPPDDFSMVATARGAFIEGIGDLIVLAEGKEEAIKAAATELSQMADKIAGLVGDAPPEEHKDDDEPDPSATPTPAPVAPPGPNPLPPPPPPPPGGGAAPGNTPAPAGAH